MTISIHRNINIVRTVVEVDAHRLGRADQMATLIALVASDDASFATGSESVADGGVTAG